MARSGLVLLALIVPLLLIFLLLPLARLHLIGRTLVAALLKFLLVTGLLRLVREVARLLVRHFGRIVGNMARIRSPWRTADLKTSGIGSGCW